MTTALPLPPITPPTPLSYFAALVASDDGLPLLEAAIACGQDEDAGLDPQSVLADVDALARRLQRRLPADAPPLQRLRLLNHFFFGELGFAGNVNHYDDPRNSDLRHVLASRRGIPISLALIYVEVASQVGLKAQGVSFPGHFLVKVRLPRGEVIIDPFSGQSLSREALDERLLPYRRERGLVGEFEAPLGLFLRAATARETLARFLRNVKSLHRRRGDWPRLLAVQERLVLVLPDVAEERRDRGLARAELGLRADAADDLRAYLDDAPDADDAPAVRAKLDALGA
jgi:regulator of sirC expression with transglutaminase-like and TPR domain